MADSYAGDASSLALTRTASHLARPERDFASVACARIVRFTCPVTQGVRMHVDDVKARLHGALHRHPKATEDEVEAIAAVVLAIVGEITVELAVIIADLASRIEVLEATA
jgi:hypothetical protein